MKAQKTFNRIMRDKNKLHNTEPIYSLSADEKLGVMEALDHIFVTKQYQEMEPCEVCKKISIKKCSSCGAFYCSTECQNQDWPRHKTICVNQRDNESHGSYMNSFKTGRNSSGTPPEDSHAFSNRNSTEITQHNFNESFPGRNEKKFTRNFRKPYQNKEQISKENEIRYHDDRNYKRNYANGPRKNFSPRKNFNSKFPEEKKVTNSYYKHTPNSKLLKSVENTSDYNRNSWSNDSEREIMEVIVTHQESSDRYWIMLAKNLQKFEEIQAEINKNIEEYEMVNPVVNCVNACYDGEWFRGVITSLTPEITIFHVDTGKTTTKYKIGVYKQLPEKIQSVPALAFPVKLDVGILGQHDISNLKSLKLTVEDITKPTDDVLRVKVIEVGLRDMGKQIPKSNGLEIPLKEKYVMNLITPVSKGILFFAPGEGILRYGSLIPDNNTDARMCLKKISNIESTAPACFQAKKGDYVLVVDEEGKDQRGKVCWSIDSIYYVRLLDCGNVISTDNVHPLPEELKELMELGVKITIQDIISEEKMKELETCLFTINGEANAGKWPCTVTSTDQEVVVKVLLENPVEENGWEPKFTNLKSGSTVEISSNCPPNNLWVRAVDAQSEQKFLDLNMELIQHGPKAESFLAPPSPGELCCAKFYDDDCFYRGVVNSYENGKASIFFVDFGNEQLTHLKDVKRLSSSLKNIPFFAVKVKLLNVSEKQWNNIVEEYIERLISQNVELTLTYEDDLRNGVTLREKVSGVTVNEFIESSLNPSNKSEKSERKPQLEVFLDDDIQFTSVDSGTEGCFVILYINELEFETELTFWATLTGVKNFDYVNSELNPLINKHCSRSSTPYEPMCRELCLAKYEDAWYRAVCGEKTGDLFKVFFVDFGNICEVESSCIRKMPEEFIRAPALAMNCTVNGHERLRENPVLKTKVLGMLLERLNTCIDGVTVTKSGDDTFVLKIPEIENILTL